MFPCYAVSKRYPGKRETEPSEARRAVAKKKRQ